MRALHILGSQHRAGPDEATGELQRAQLRDARKRIGRIERNLDDA